MKNEFTEVMSQKTDQELKKIIASGRRKYQVTALDAAEAEANKRGVDISKIKTKVKRKTVRKRSKPRERKDGVLIWFFGTIIEGILESLFIFVLAIFSSIFNF